MTEDGKFAWMLLAGVLDAGLQTADSTWYVYMGGILFSIFAAAPLIWTFLFVLVLVQFGKKALWMLPAAPFAMLSIAAYFGLVYSY